MLFCFQFGNEGSKETVSAFNTPSGTKNYNESDDDDFDGEDNYKPLREDSRHHSSSRSNSSKEALETSDDQHHRQFKTKIYTPNQYKKSRHHKEQQRNSSTSIDSALTLSSSSTSLNAGTVGSPRDDRNLMTNVMLETSMTCHWDGCNILIPKEVKLMDHILNTHFKPEELKVGIH